MRCAGKVTVEPCCLLRVDIDASKDAWEMNAEILKDNQSVPAKLLQPDAERS